MSPKVTNPKDRESVLSPQLSPISQYDPTGTVTQAPGVPMAGTLVPSIWQQEARAAPT